MTTVKYYILKENTGNFRKGDIITGLESEFDKGKVLPLTGDVIPKNALMEVIEND